MSILKYLISAFLLCFVVACAGPHVRDKQPVKEVDLSTDGEERLHLPESSDRSIGQGAFEKLLKNADDALVKKNYARATALIERAIRLSPQNGYAYLSLARVHYYQADYSKSRSFLSRARTLAAGDTKLVEAVELFDRQLRANSAPGAFSNTGY